MRRPHAQPAPRVRRKVSDVTAPPAVVIRHALRSLHGWSFSDAPRCRGRCGATAAARWRLAPPPLPTVAPTRVPTVHSLPKGRDRCARGLLPVGGRNALLGRPRSADVRAVCVVGCCYHKLSVRRNRHALRITTALPPPCALPLRITTDTVLGHVPDAMRWQTDLGSSSEEEEEEEEGESSAEGQTEERGAQFSGARAPPAAAGFPLSARVSALRGASPAARGKFRLSRAARGLAAAAAAPSQVAQRRGNDRRWRGGTWIQAAFTRAAFQELPGSARPLRAALPRRTLHGRSGSVSFALPSVCPYPRACAPPVTYLRRRAAMALARTWQGF